MADGDSTSNYSSLVEEKNSDKNDDNGSGSSSDTFEKVGSEDIDELAQESDEAITISEKADELKEHDVIDEEKEEANKMKGDLEKEIIENDGWTKILGNEQLMKKVIKEGIANTRPQRGDLVTINIKGKLKDDELVVFEDQKNHSFQLGDAEVITGLDLTLPLMCKGEVALVQVAPRFGYGSKGLPPLVPPLTPLMFEVELTNFETEKDLEELTIAQRRDIGISRKRVHFR